MKKGNIIFLIAFFITMAGVTAALVLGNVKLDKSANSEKENAYVASENGEVAGEQKETSAKITPDNLGVKSVTEKYNQNAIEVIDENLSQKEFDASKAKLYIEGLKDTSVQSKINTSIATTLQQFIKDTDSGEITYTVVGNFGNVLSIVLNSKSKTELSERDKYNKDLNAGTIDWDNSPKDTAKLYTKYINLNLVTGEKLKFTDLFTNTANMSGVLAAPITTGLTTVRL
jgi:hypothetical protein